MSRPRPLPLLCPHCGSEFSPVLEYTGHAYSEHRDLTGYECDRWECGAEWDKFGAPTVPSKMLPELSR